MNMFNKSPRVHYKDLIGKVSQMLSDDYVYNLEEVSCIKPVENLFNQWLERVNHYLYQETYLLKDSETYKDCNDFIIFNKYRLSNLDNDLVPKCYVLQGSEWVEILPSDEKWKINWIFSKMDFWRAKDHQISSMKNAESLIFKMAFEDVFGVTYDYISAYNRNVWDDSYDSLEDEIKHNYLKLLHIFENIVSLPYSGKFTEEPHFKTKKERTEWLKTLRNPHYINIYRRFDTERKINQIVIKLINKDFFELLKGTGISFSLKNCFQAASTVNKSMPRLVKWKQENANKFIFFSLILNHPYFAEYVNDDNFFGNDNRLKLILINRNYKSDSLGSFILTKKALHLLFNLPKTLFLKVMSIFINQNPQKGIIILNWLGSTFAPRKLNVWCAIGVFQTLWLSNNKITGFDKQNDLNKLYKALSLTYECCLISWNKTKKVSEFFVEIEQTHILADYTHFLFFNRTENEMLTLPNIYGIALNSNLQSIKRKSEEWHKIRVLENIENINYPFPNITECIDGFDFQLIQNSSEAALEAYEVQHCLYTNYNRMMIEGAYMAFRVNGEDIRGTFGAFVSKNALNPNLLELKYDQCFSVRNTRMPKNAHSACKRLVQKINKKNIKYLI